jgi:hypothetical protein
LELNLYQKLKRILKYEYIYFFKLNQQEHIRLSQRSYNKIRKIFDYNICNLYLIQEESKNINEKIIKKFYNINILFFGCDQYILKNYFLF